MRRRSEAKDSVPRRPRQKLRARFGWILVVALLAHASMAHALSLFDVIQLSKAGYSNEKLIELIETTQSRFDLDASDLIAAKDAGISEPVIRALLARPSNSRSERPDPPRPSPPRRSSLRNIDSSPFTVGRFEESQSSHGDSHEHYALLLEGVTTLILRSEGQWNSTQERANSIVTALNQAVTEHPGGYFLVPVGGDPTVWYGDASSDERVPVLSVLPGDVVGYQKKSLGVVSAARLANYWAALLNDHTSALLFDRPPRDLVGLHLGEAIEALYRELNSNRDEDKIVDDRPSTASRRILRALDHLQSEDREHLLELATRIPSEFELPREVTP